MCLQSPTYFFIIRSADNLIGLIIIFCCYIAIVIKPSNIRIWIHDKDIPKLTKVVWEGQGMRLKQEASSHPKVRRLLDSIPYIMVRRFFYY